MAYTRLPTGAQWRNDVGVEALKIPAAARILALLNGCAETRDTVVIVELVYHIYRHTEYLLKNRNNKLKLGGTNPANLTRQQVGAITDLHDYIRRELNPDDSSFLEYFGKAVSEAGQGEDAHAVHANMMHYFTTKAARKPYKLAFRGGIAHKWQVSRWSRHLEIYDTAAFHDNIESGMSLYVMDGHGRIFVGGQELEEKSFKHSTFLGGEPTAAAGTMKVVNGLVTWVTGRSGHYRPTVQQMCNLLERLRDYGVDLKLLTVFRENFSDEYKTGTPERPRYMEPTWAAALLNRRSWPGAHPYSMRVGGGVP